MFLQLDPLRITGALATENRFHGRAGPASMTHPGGAPHSSRRAPLLTSLVRPPFALLPVLGEARWAGAVRLIVRFEDRSSNNSFCISKSPGTDTGEWRRGDRARSQIPPCGNGSRFVMSTSERLP